MKLGIRGKLLLVWLLVMVGGGLLAEAFLNPRVERMLIDRIRDDLFIRLALCEREAALVDADHKKPSDWDLLANELGKTAAARVTFISSKGVVLGDSGVPLSDLERMENHLGRPEVEEALAKGRGATVRLSPTLHVRMMYAAMPYGRQPDGLPSGLVRLSVPLSDVDRAASQLHRVLATAATLFAAVTLLLSTAAVHLISRTLRRLTDAATTMAEGNLAVRTEVAGEDEVARLGQALDRLGQSLSKSLSALRDERDLLDRILGGMHEGVLLLDGNGRVQAVNASLRDMLLLSADVVGQPLLEAIRHGQIKDLLDRAGKASAELTAEIVVHGLKPRQLLVHAAKLSGEPAGVLAVFVDVSEIRRLESLRRDFVANVSHELRTPIAAVRSAAETLADVVCAEPDAAPAFIDIIQRNSDRLQRLIDDLLDLSRIESLKFRVNLEPVALGSLLEHLLASFEDRAGQRNLRLVGDIPEGIRPARADRRAIEQVLSNLIENAVKYCSDGAEVRVRAEEEGRVIRIVVEDTGPGIESRHLPRLFERFYRVDAGRSREVGGTGLGLSIVKHLVEAMKGTVTVESAVGKGSRFIVTLPVSPTSNPADEAAPVELPGGGASQPGA